MQPGERAQRYHELEAYRLARVLLATVYSATSEISLRRRDARALELRRHAVSTVTHLLDCRSRSSFTQYRRCLERSRGELSRVAICLEKVEGELPPESLDSIRAVHTQLDAALTTSVESLG